MRILDSFSPTDAGTLSDRELRVWIAALSAAIQAGHKHPYDTADSAVKAFRDRAPKRAEEAR